MISKCAHPAENLDIPGTWYSSIEANFVLHVFVSLRKDRWYEEK